MTNVPLISRRPIGSAGRLIAGGSVRYLLSAALLAAPLAHAQVVDILWDAQGQFKRELRADPGKFVELCGKLGLGSKVEWRFDADGSTNFNIHYHEGKTVQFPAKEDGTRAAQGTLRVGSAQDYCWMWSNKTAAAVAVSVELTKQP